MDQLWCRVLLLPLCLCLASEVTEKKIIGREPDATPICSNTTEDIITLIVCKIRTKRTGEECRLAYRFGGYKQRCDPRFTLIMENQTVFLHLTSLTPVDSGNYTCECSHDGGTDILHLNITVEEEGDTSWSTHILILVASIAVTVVITITGVIFGFICLCKRKLHRDGSRSATSGVPVCETPDSFEEDDPDDPYTSLQQQASDLYQTITHSRRNVEHICFDNQEIDGGETDSCADIYENVTP